jgi:hypothetical protein
MDRLADGGAACPVDLDEAVAAAGIEAGDGEVAVEVSEGSGDGGQDASALDQVGGVYVDCTRPVDGGEVTAVVFASERPEAVGLLLPQLQHELDLDIDALPDVLDRVEATDEGDLVDLGAEGPVAVARIDVDGAESAVVYVSAPDLSTDEVQTVAEKILDDL